jgi:hypothetical protein
MDERIGDLEREVEALKERNRRVEGDKAWETSWARMLTIALTTYIVAVVVLYIVDVADFLLAALVPTLGYVLSTQSIPVIKRWWLGAKKTDL